MASITIRNLDAQLKTWLRVRAAQHERSMEEEVRVILKTVLTHDRASETGLGSRIHDRFKALGGVELEGINREPIRDPDGFAE